jgi:hypothetical protein
MDGSGLELGEASQFDPLWFAGVLVLLSFNKADIAG